ncbi:hypothetical protein [Sphingomonas endophytica]|uniref:hypothetical protein n=1 Tax=Sphingomonas endophytica TaxID=869719 RepID=UPI0007368A34|nr:hypothetical protein [Sphingomonas endophytica]
MELVHLYKSMIDAIVAAAGSAALLHVHAGMAIYLGTLAVVRNRRGGVVALQMVFAAEMANEAMDWLAASPQWTWSDTLSDIVLTLMWPVAITGVNGLRRRRWRRTVVQDQLRTISPSARAHTPIASA